MEDAVGAIEIGFNATNLPAFLSAVDATTVVREQKDEATQGLLRPGQPVAAAKAGKGKKADAPAGDGGEYKYVVMPMRI